MIFICRLCQASKPLISGLRVRRQFQGFGQGPAGQVPGELFHPAGRFIQLLFQGRAQAQALFKVGQSLIQSQAAVFQPADQFFQPGQTIFKSRFLFFYFVSSTREMKPPSASRTRTASPGLRDRPAVTGAVWPGRVTRA
jgi:hypothetical protein